MIQDYNFAYDNSIFDAHDKYSELIRNIYPFFRSKLDPDLARILPSEPIFKPDTEFLPIQAADMLAWLFRKLVERTTNRMGVGRNRVDACDPHVEMEHYLYEGSPRERAESFG